MSASAAPAPGPRRRPLRGVVFDMDGTLTVPVIDFQAMYREVLGGDAAYAAARAAGGGAVDILHCIEDWAPDKQRHAYEVIARFEQEGLDRLQIMPGQAATTSACLAAAFGFLLVSSSVARCGV
jgi:phosphoserine phosphatase